MLRILMCLVIMYAVFSILVATIYTILYHRWFMSDVVKKARIDQKLGVYGWLWFKVFIKAPIGVYEIYKEIRKRKGLTK